jgi:hypothetical protein
MGSYVIASCAEPGLRGERGNLTAAGRYVIASCAEPGLRGERGNLTAAGRYVIASCVEPAGRSERGNLTTAGRYVIASCAEPAGRGERGNLLPLPSQKLRNPLFDFIPRAAEVGQSLLLGARESHRILDRPMLLSSGAWDDRANLPGVIANREDEIPVIPDVPINVFGALTGDIDTGLLHDPRRQRMDPRGNQAG